MLPQEQAPTWERHLESSGLQREQVEAVDTGRARQAGQGWDSEMLSSAEDLFAV